MLKSIPCHSYQWSYFQKQDPHHFPRQCYISEHLYLLDCFPSEAHKLYKPGDTKLHLVVKPPRPEFAVNPFFTELLFCAKPCCGLDTLALRGNVYTMALNFKFK